MSVTKKKIMKMIYIINSYDTLETAVHTAAAGWNARLPLELEVSTEE